MTFTSLSMPFTCARCIRAQAARLTQPKRLIATTAITASTVNSRARAVERRRWSTQSDRSRFIQATGSSLPPKPSITHHHAYSTETAPKKKRRMTAQLPWRRLLVVHGRDTAKFLQGILTQDMNIAKLRESFSQGRAVYAASLDAKGRMYAEMLIYPWNAKEGRPVVTEEEGDQGLALEVDEGVVEFFMGHLRKHKLRSKVKIELLGQEWGVSHHWTMDAWEKSISSIYGNPSPPEPSEEDDILPTPESDDLETTTSFLDPRFHGPSASTNFRSLSSSPSSSPQPQHQTPSQSIYHTHRYLHCIPEGPLENPPGTALAYDSNIDIHGGISFHKGCYLGQELVIRTKHTGVVRKRVLPVRITWGVLEDGHPEIMSIEEGRMLRGSPTLPLDIWKYPMDSETPSSSSSRPKKQKPVGKLLAYSGSIGLALVRLDAMTSLRLTAHETAPREETNEFFAATDPDSRKLKVQVIIPDWLPPLVEPPLKPAPKQESLDEEQLGWLHDNENGNMGDEDIEARGQVGR